ncbi:phage tail fiber protein [Serratia fonticola]
MWYKTGTINLTANNATITGTGTAWADAKFGVMPGMILLAPDNKLYEVKQVNSNTSLTLNSNYVGSTASGQSYAIITTYEGDISQFSARFAAMLTFFQGSRNDTVSWFTGSGDMTFTKDDGTKLTVPTLTKIQSDYLSRSSTANQHVAGSVSFSQPMGLSLSTSPGFLPRAQGAWVGWNRMQATPGYADGATEFMNHKGARPGGFNFWNSDGKTADILTIIGATGNITTKGSLSSIGDQHMQADPSTANLLLRFKNVDGMEKSSIYAQTDTGQLNIRWNGITNSATFRPDGFVSLSNGLTFNTAYNTAESVPDLGVLPVIFRGPNTGGISSGTPNTVNIGTSFGFAIVPTSADGLAEGVERGKPVFSVSARSGIVYALNDIKVGTQSVLKAGDGGIGGYTSQTVTDNTTAGVNQFFRFNANTSGAPGTSAWAGIMGGYDGASRFKMAWAMGSATVDLRTQVRAPNGTLSSWLSLRHSGNTTVDANGFIKAASPIVKLFGTGESELNDQSQGVITERISKGVYRVSGVRGFNADGAWGGAGNGIEIPVDDNKRPLVWVESKVLSNGDIEIRTYHRTYDTGPYSARNIEAMDSGEADKKNQPIFVEMPDGTPIDIPKGRFIDLRIEMPAVDEPEPVIELESVSAQ